MNRKLAIEEFTISEAVKYSELPSTMLDYLCRSDVLVPSVSGCPGRGRPRKYSFGDLVILRVLSKLLERGVAVSRIKRALQQLRTSNTEITRGSLPGRYLVTDGQSVFFANRNGVIENLNAGGQFAFAFVVEVKHVRDDVVARIKKNNGVRQSRKRSRRKSA